MSNQDGEFVVCLFSSSVSLLSVGISAKSSGEFQNSLDKILNNTIKHGNDWNLHTKPSDYYQCISYYQINIGYCTILAMQQMWVYFYEQNCPVYGPSFFSTVPLSIFQKVIFEMDKTGGGGGGGGSGKPLITSLIHKSSSFHPTPILPLVQ